MKEYESFAYSLEVGLNIYKIAKEANISITTVSRVVNKSGYVKPETRKRILAVIKKYNYRPRLVRSKITNILILINDKNIFFSSYISNLMNGISKAVSELNLQETIAKVDNNEHPEAVLKLIQERNADGVIVLLAKENTKYLNYLKKMSVPFLLLNNSKFDKFNYIDIDNYTGMYQLMEYVYEKGHKNIGYLTYNLKDGNMIDRYNAFVDFCKERKIEHNIKNVIVIDKNLSSDKIFTPYELGYMNAEKLLKNTKNISLIMGSSDEIAFGIMYYLNSIGKSIPNDISVTGFDNYIITNFISPRLTTVEQNLVELGSMAVFKIFSLINNSQQKTSIKLSANLIKGNSVKDLRK